MHLVANIGSEPISTTTRRICCHISTGTRSVVESKRSVFGWCGVLLLLFCLKPFARLLLNVNMHNCGKLAVPLLTAAICLTRPRTAAQVQNAVLIIRNSMAGRHVQYYYASHYLQVRGGKESHGKRPLILVILFFHPFFLISSTR